MRKLTFGLVAFGALLCEATQLAEDVVVETKAFRLVIGADAGALDVDDGPTPLPEK